MITNQVAGQHLMPVGSGIPPAASHADVRANNAEVSTAHMHGGLPHSM